jgi:hypothetical protein
VDAEDAMHRVLTANVLTGSQTVTTYAPASSFTVPAIAIQAKTGDQNRTFVFDGNEYRKLPAYLETDFVAPDPAGPTTARLFLFTLGFRRQIPPLVDCSVVASGRNGGPLSSSFQFGCFTSVRLQDIDPELAFPDLGSERGRLRLTCTVRGGDDEGVVGGGVHGILVQTENGRTWGSVLTPSSFAGCPATLRLAEPYRGDGF